MGGRECRVPLFVSEVERSSVAAEVGLMRADVLLELNGQNVEHVLHSRACEILRGALQLTLVVKNHKARIRKYFRSLIIEHVVFLRSVYFLCFCLIWILLYLARLLVYLIYLYSYFL